MIKDEARFSLMCEISMALKSPKLQQGFEIICKNLSDLEKENAELKSIADFQTSSNIDRHFQLKRSKEKLNKAKEILKVVLNKWKEERWILQSEKEVKMIENVMERASQFLKED